MCAHKWAHMPTHRMQRASQAKHVRLVKYGRRLHIFLQWGLVIVR